MFSPWKAKRRHTTHFMNKKWPFWQKSAPPNTIRLIRAARRCERRAHLNVWATPQCARCLSNTSVPYVLHPKSAHPWHTRKFYLKTGFEHLQFSYRWERGNGAAQGGRESAAGARSRCLLLAQDGSGEAPAAGKEGKGGCWRSLPAARPGGAPAQPPCTRACRRLSAMAGPGLPRAPSPARPRRARPCGCSSACPQGHSCN